MARRRTRRSKKAPVEAKPEAEKQYASKLIQWAADGYAVEPLEEMMKVRDPGLSKAFEVFEENIGKIGAIRKELDALNLVGLDADVEILLKLMNKPMEYPAIEDHLTMIRKKMRVRDMAQELERFDTPALKDRVTALMEKISDLSKLDEAETEFAEIQRLYKESFFLGEITEELERAPVVTKRLEEAKKVERPAVPMVVSDLFLMYKDGKFISHHTARVADRTEQGEIFANLKTARNYIRSPKYMPKRLNVINLDSKKLVLMSGDYLIAVLSATGDVNPWTDRIVGKVLSLMEKEDSASLRAWTGDPSSLKSVGKYMTALLYACMKLAKKNNAE
ncbi:MAG: hypothetical protein AB1665_01250 [Candidatus Thermoplasmatota archaeon]